MTRLKAIARFITGSSTRRKRFQPLRPRQRQSRSCASADWLTLSPDGTARADVRLTLESASGELVFVEYEGILLPESGVAYTCPRFKTGAPGLAWLNRVQAVGKAYFDAEAMTVTYPQIYALR